MMNLSSRRSRAVIALAAVLTLTASIAEARAGRGGSFGSRGGRTFDPPPATRTAPTPASPIERSQVPQNQFQNRPGVPPGAQVAQPRRFGSGLFAGLLGAGLLGMLFGSGFFGGLAGLASIFGLLIQVALVALLATLAFRWFRRRQGEATPAPAYARSSAGGQGGSVPPAPAGGGGLGASLGGALGSLGSRPRVHDAPRQAPRRPGVRDEINIGEADYAAFERTLHEVQGASSKGDVATLWTLATPEMAGYLQEELNEDAGRGVVNTVSNVRLLQGDLAEAWREGPVDYATVAMRFAHSHVATEKATGKVVEGDPTRIIEVTELWTFRRDQGGDWKLSAIQQG